MPTKSETRKLLEESYQKKLSTTFIKQTEGDSKLSQQAEPSKIHQWAQNWSTRWTNVSSLSVANLPWTTSVVQGRREPLQDFLCHTLARRAQETDRRNPPNPKCNSTWNWTEEEFASNKLEPKTSSTKQNSRGKKCARTWNKPQRIPQPRDRSLNGSLLPQKPV